MSTFPTAPVPQSPPSPLSIRKRSIEIIDYTLCISYICLSITIGYVLAVGPARYHDSKALELVSGLGIPWLAISVVFIVNALLLCNRITRVAGWALGALLYGYYLISIFMSIVLQGNSGSAFALAAATAAFFSQLSGLARSIVAAEWRDTGAL